MSTKNAIKLCLLATIFYGKMTSSGFCADAGNSTDWPLSIIVQTETGQLVTINPGFSDDCIPARILGTGTKLHKLELIQEIYATFRKNPNDVSLRILIAIMLHNSPQMPDRYQVCTSALVDITEGIKGAMIWFYGDRSGEIVIKLRDIPPESEQVPEVRILFEMIEEITGFA